MKIALLCSGVGNVKRGHEVFAQSLFRLLQKDMDITLFKGGGESAEGEFVIDHVPRGSTCLNNVQLAVSPKWHAAAVEQERIRVECTTFSYSALRLLLEGGFDIIHCLEEETANIVYAERHLFARPPNLLFSNGGAIPARKLPRCDFVQEHTRYNLARSDPKRAFYIPHGVDTRLFDPSKSSTYRATHGIPADAFVVISVGAVCYWHKRMDYVIREIAELDDVYLLVAGQDGPDSAEIKSLGRRLLGERVRFENVQHDLLPGLYAAADAFVLGSLFETFGIAYIEAMAMQLPVFCTNHENQRSVIKEGIFLDMSKRGSLASAIRAADRDELRRLGKEGRRIVEEEYELDLLKRQYRVHYERIARNRPDLPKYTFRKRLAANLRNVVDQLLR